MQSSTPSRKPRRLGDVLSAFLLVALIVALAATALTLFSGSLAYSLSLRSQLNANYAGDPGGPVRSLRLSIFEEVLRDLGLSGDIGDRLGDMFDSPVPAATPSATPPTATGSATASATLTRTPTGTIRPSSTPTRTPTQGISPTPSPPRPAIP